MKTKTNEIPLSGPRGRKDLIKLVNKANTDVDEKLSVLEETLGITLEPNIDEKYYQYFTIEATEDGTGVYFRQSSYAANEGIAPLKVEVSTDDGETWQEITAAPAEDDVPGTEITTLGAGDKILVRGDNEAYGYYSSSAADTVENCNFWANKNCYVYGNIMSLISRDNFARLRKVKDGAFAYFFLDYNEELSSWVLSKEEETLLLPATSLARDCYKYMFVNCTGLTLAPELPATVLADECYYSMFSSCTSLVASPELPATTLAKNCYDNMFSSCTSLTTAPSILPATTLKEACYDSMFSGCTRLSVAPELPATTLAENCYSGMFYSCTSLVVAPELPATTLSDYCYKNMFSGCSSLETAPKLPATTLALGCYAYMFEVCTNLTTAPELSATTLASGCYGSMFSGCTSLAAAPKLPATTLAEDCYSGMFRGCTDLTVAPELTATTLARGCYSSMFNGCTNLNYIKAMFTTTPSATYTSNWVFGVSQTGTFVKNSAATWDVTGAHGIPTGWTVETADA